MACNSTQWFLRIIVWLFRFFVTWLLLTCSPCCLNKKKCPWFYQKQSTLLKGKLTQKGIFLSEKENETCQLLTFRTNWPKTQLITIYRTTYIEVNYDIEFICGSLRPFTVLLKSRISLPSFALFNRRFVRYVICSKFTTKPRFGDIFSNLRCPYVVFTWVFFSSFLLWWLAHGKIYNFHY